MSKELLEIVQAKLQSLSLSDELREKYEKRLKWEVAEINGQVEWPYFIGLHESKTRYAHNQNNLLFMYLLGVVPDFDITADPAASYGDFPDIDTDYLPIVRDYLKNEWAAKTFGEDKVCNISNYTTFGIKSALIDMARVHGESREDVLELTKKLEGKDEDGKALTWESALKGFPELAQYCNAHPDIAEATKRLINRNRGMGIHAGGLIISNRRLDDFVPLVKRKDAPHASAWVEGLHGQDLQPVGLVKFDLLVISNLLQIAKGCKLAKDANAVMDLNRMAEQSIREIDPTTPMMSVEATDLANDTVRRIKENQGITGICALPGQPDWSDVDKWRNDPKALEMANAGDLKCIFQFDSEGIRALVRDGGVTNFGDLVAYTALFRPGPLGMKMQERYVLRKKGKERWYEELHPIMRPILEKTYGVMVYQEQVMQILNKVGEVPLKDCELVRKAISKKEVAKFAKYKEMFLANGQRNLQASEEDLNNLWNQIEAFAEYGFNKSHAVAYTYISGRLLYLKAHYPHEFYAAILACEDLAEKIKEYKIEAKIHNVELARVDVNKSHVTFLLRDDRKIYYGLSNIKGIGDGPAQRIVASQPYVSFEDFLDRFGTDAPVVKALVGLRCWAEDPVRLLKFSDYYRESIKKEEDRQRRYIVSMAKYITQLKELTLDETATFDESLLPKWEHFNVDETVETPEAPEISSEEEEIEGEPLSEEEISQMEVEMAEAQCSPGEIIDEGDKELPSFSKRKKRPKIFNRYKEIVRLFARRVRSINNHARKNVSTTRKPTLAKFDDTLLALDAETLAEVRSKTKSEERYYGFAWESRLELSPDFNGRTFEQFDDGNEHRVAPVQVEIKKLEHRTGKKVSYKRLTVVDAHGKSVMVMVWMDDWDRWAPELTVGNLVSMRLKAPSGGFSTFSLDSVPKHQRYLLPKNKSDDFRVVVLREGQPEDRKFVSIDDMMDQIKSDLGEQ